MLLELEGVCLRVLSVGISHFNVECLAKVYTTVVNVFKPIKGGDSSTAILIVELVFSVFPAGETFTVTLNNVEGTVGLTCVVLDGEAGTVAAGYEAGGGDAHAVVADGGKLDGGTYLNFLGYEEVSITVNERVTPFVGEGNYFGGFAGLLGH